MNTLLLFAAITDIWAGLPTHPAVVNSVSYETFGRPAEVISLSGEWDFRTANHGSGIRSVRFDKDIWKDGARNIRVPAVWEAEGVGERGMGIPYLCADNAPKELRHVFAGEGWYRRTVEVPAGWRGKRVWLKAGGVRSQGWFYVNDHPVAWLDTATGAWKWEVTDFIRFGETNKIVVMADNAVAQRGGTDSFCNRWGGIWREIELEATPQAFIDDAWVRGDFDKRIACVEVKVEGEGEQRNGNFILRATVDGVKKDAILHPSPSPQTFTLEIPLGNFRPWTPEHPNLYWAKIELLDGDRCVQVRHERFGVRKFEVRGKELYLNNRPFFVRGCGDNAPYPLTGTSPADRDFHRRHLAVARRAGFNFIRQHTHSEAPEYMEAADELGILVQPELPYYLDNPNDYFGYDPLRDVDALVTAFRRYVSFAVLSYGNEARLGPAASRIVYEHLKKTDPDRLVLAEDGGTYLSPDHAAGESDYCSGPLTTWARGTFNPRAFVCHEYLNLAAKLEWRDERDFTGCWLPPITADDRRRLLSHTGLSMPWLERLQDAAHALQAYWQKYGLELARADPYCDGYIYWTICDSTPFNQEAGCRVGQGMFDVFWRTKRGGRTPEATAVFNSSSCVLFDNEPDRLPPVENTDPLLLCAASRPCIEGTNRVFAAGETIDAKFLFAHFGEEELPAAVLDWRLATADGVLKKGTVGIGRQPLGPAREVARVPIAVSDVTAPVKAMLSVAVRASDARSFCVTNAWPVWLFPRQAARAEPENVVVAAYGSPAAEQARKDGKNLLLVANQDGRSNFLMGWWNIGTQCGTAILPHPVLGDFPADPFLSPLFFRIIKEGLKLPVVGFSERDYVMVGEGLRDAYLYLAAKERPDGSREALVAGLDISGTAVEGASLRANVLSWLSKGGVRQGAHR